MTIISGTTGNDEIVVSSSNYGYQCSYTIYGGDGSDFISISAAYVNDLRIYRRHQ